MASNHPAMDNLIKAIINDDANRIRSVLKQKEENIISHEHITIDHIFRMLLRRNGKELVLNNLLKLKHTVNLKEDQVMVTLRSSCIIKNKVRFDLTL